MTWSAPEQIPGDCAGDDPDGVGRILWPENGEIVAILNNHVVVVRQQP
jgi:hypothetical protein